MTKRAEYCKKIRGKSYEGCGGDKHFCEDLCKAARHCRTLHQLKELSNKAEAYAKEKLS